MESSLYTNIFLFALSWLCLFASAYLFFRLKKVKVGLILLVFSGLALRIQVSNDKFLHKWDERYHALVAKNLSEDPSIPLLYKSPVLPYDYKNWTSNHIWVHKPPVTLYLIAASIEMFGSNEFAVRIPSIFFSTLSILLVYLIGSKIFSEKTGYIAGVLFSINGLIIELCGGRVATDHVDTLFTFFVLASIYAAIMHVKTKRNTFFVFYTALTALAILTKSLPALTSYGVWLTLAVLEQHSKKELFKTSVLFFILLIFLVSPWYIYIYNRFPDETTWEYFHMTKHVTEALDEQTGPWYYFLDKMRINYGELIYLPLLWFMYSLFKSKFSNSYHIGVLTWIILPYLFFSITKTKMQAYTVLSAPALFIVTAHFLLHLYEKGKNSKYQIVYNLTVFLLIALPLRYSYERAKPFRNQVHVESWANEMKLLKGTFVNEKVIAFNIPAPVEFMFYTGYIAYETVPDEHVLKELQNKGWTIVLNNYSLNDRSIQYSKIFLSPPLN